VKVFIYVLRAWGWISVNREKTEERFQEQRWSRY